jgi:hypothetical protein
MKTFEIKRKYLLNEDLPWKAERVRVRHKSPFYNLVETYGAIHVFAS